MRQFYNFYCSRVVFVLFTQEFIKACVYVEFVEKILEVRNTNNLLIDWSFFKCALKGVL